MESSPFSTKIKRFSVCLSVVSTFRHLKKISNQVAMRPDQAQQEPHQFGISVPEIGHAFCLLLANVSAFMAFLILATAKVSEDVLSKSNTTTTSTHFSLKFDDFTALEFTEFITVVEWIWSLGLVAMVVTVQLMDVWKPSPAVERFIKRGSVSHPVLLSLFKL